VGSIEKTTWFYEKIELGELIGYEVPPSHPSNRKWVLVRKDKVFKPRVEDLDDLELIELLRKKDAKVLNFPYHIGIRELPIEIHDSEKYESQEDYIIFENFRFPNIDGMVNYLQSLGLQPQSARPAIDIGAP